MITTTLESSVQPVTANAGPFVPLLRAALRHKALAGAVAAAVIGLAALIALLLPPRYTATVVILPPQQSASAGAAMIAQLGAMASLGGSGLGIKNPNDLQVALLKSASVENAMAARFGLQQEYGRRYLSATRKRWERATAIDNGLKDGLIRLSVTDRDARRAAELANGWVEEYRRFAATLAVTEAAQRRLFFEQQLKEAGEALTNAEEQMKRTEQRTGVIEIDAQAHAMIASAAVLRAQVAAKQVEIQAMRQFAADGNPDLQRTQQELIGLEGQLSAMDVANERRGGDLIAPKGALSQAGLEYVRAMREVKYRETIHDLLTRQYEMARVDEARQGAQVQIVDPGAVPDRPVMLFRLWIVLAGLLLALPLGIATAGMAELAAILRGYRTRADSWPAALDAALAGAAQ